MTAPTRRSSQIETVSAVDAAAAILSDQIMSGVYRAGERIREAPLASEFGISRHTLRAALSRLETVGLLVFRENRGWSLPVFDQAEYEDILLLRQALESMAYQITVNHAIQPDQEVDAALQRMLDLGPDADWSERLKLDCALHQSLVDLAGSKRLSQAFSDMMTEFRLCRLQSADWLDEISLDRWKKLHVSLVDSVRCGDIAALEQAASHYQSSPWSTRAYMNEDHDSNGA